MKFIQKMIRRQAVANYRLPVAEQLEHCIARLDGDAYYDFGDWGHCTVGHLYQEIAGGAGKSSEVRSKKPSDAYKELIKVVALANGCSKTNHGERMGFISDHTCTLSAKYGCSERAAASRMFKKALADVEKEQRKHAKALAEQLTANAKKMPQPDLTVGEIKVERQDDRVPV